jgi:hypothetical protein
LLDSIVMDAESGRFYSGALSRISRSMIALAGAFSPVVWLHYGWRIALGFACGCAVAYLNFHWLKQVVGALTERATANASQTSPGTAVVLRFLVRYALMALAAYVIFTVSRASVYGFFAGLFLPVAAIACEAAYEVYAALARGL